MLQGGSGSCSVGKVLRLHELNLLAGFGAVLEEWLEEIRDGVDGICSLMLVRQRRSDAKSSIRTYLERLLEGVDIVQVGLDNFGTLLRKCLSTCRSGISCYGPDLVAAIFEKGINHRSTLATGGSCHDNGLGGGRHGKCEG